MQLRPVVLFSGVTGLMSAVWSAPADLTSAFKVWNDCWLSVHEHRFPPGRATWWLTTYHVIFIFTMAWSFITKPRVPHHLTYPARHRLVCGIKTLTRWFESGTTRQPSIESSSCFFSSSSDTVRVSVCAVTSTYWTTSWSWASTWRSAQTWSLITLRMSITPTHRLKCACKWVFNHQTSSE